MANAIKNTRKRTSAGTRTKAQAPAREYVHTPRIASFIVTKTKTGRIFTPVNKRAKKLALKVGKRTRVTAAELKQFQGYHKLRQYAGTDGKQLKAIKF